MAKKRKRKTGRGRERPVDKSPPRTGLSVAYRTRIDQLPNKKWVIEIVSKAGRLQFTSPEYLHEKQARTAAVRCINALRSMPPATPEDIETKRHYKLREGVEPLPSE